MMEQQWQDLKDKFVNTVTKTATVMTRLTENSFVMENFSKEKNKDKYNDWTSPTKYTHPGGYKFCIGIDANGCDGSRGKAITVELWSKSGDFGNVLVWPAKFVFTIELLNCKGGDNWKVKSFC